MQIAWHDQRIAIIPAEARLTAEHPTVAVVIPAFNQARFLGEAIKSVLAQTRAADQIIVVDDGSTDNPADVVAQFPTVKFFRQDNRGPSAARNTGLRHCTASHVVFLDGDDRLLPKALEAGLGCMAIHPDCAFVYGGYRYISADGNRSSEDRLRPIEGDSHLEMLRWNPIVMHGTVLYRRQCLLEVDGFDEGLRRAEDLDLYLRLSYRYSVAYHRETIAEYRRHGQNASNNYVGQLKTICRVFDRHAARINVDVSVRAALQAARAREQKYYVSAMLRMAKARWHDRHDIGVLVKDLMQAAQRSPRITMHTLIRALGRRAIKVLPDSVAQWFD